MNHDTGATGISRINQHTCNFQQSPPHGMDGVGSSHEGNGSDYGSDINSDEEVILSSLLRQTPVSQTTGPPLILNDIEENEAPKGAKLPRVLGREKYRHANISRGPKHISKKRIPMEIESYRSFSTPGESGRAISSNAD